MALERTVVRTNSIFARTIRAGKNFVRTNWAAHLNHLISTNSLHPDDVDALCTAAEGFEIGPTITGGSAGKTVALLFFQSSTRTRLGFECGGVPLAHIASAWRTCRPRAPMPVSAELIEDCAAVVSRLADAIVVRHHECSAVARMAATSVVPVINAGDGWNEHPSQALIDIHAMRRGLGTLRGEHRVRRRSARPRGALPDPVASFRGAAGDRVLSAPHYEVPERYLSAVAENQFRYRNHGYRIALIECDAVMMAPYDMSASASRRLRTTFRLTSPRRQFASLRRRSSGRAPRLCSIIRCRVSTKSTRPATGCRMPCISSRFASRNSCGWRCSIWCFRQIENLCHSVRAAIR